MCVWISACGDDNFNIKLVCESGAKMKQFSPDTNCKRMCFSYFLTLLCVSVATSAVISAEKIFEEDFDDQPDWTSTMHSLSGSQEVTEGDILPDNWDKIYQSTKWSPETGYPENRASLEILSSNSDKARGGVGKSAVFWRESYNAGWNNWASDAQFIKVLDDYHDEIYIEFWIRFSPNWWQRDVENYGNWTSKIFRVGSYSGEGSIFNGAGGQIGPRFFWNYQKNQYGTRNIIRYFEGPHGSGGSTETGNDGNKNFLRNTRGMGVGGSDPKIPDLVNGGYLLDSSGPIEHEQVYGTTEVWTKMAFYLKLNSAPGIDDGVFKQWINDEQFYFDDSITWIPESAEEEQMLGWNYLAIGGNDYFQPVDNEERFEDWYAIDDLRVYSGIPNTPMPPSGFLMESD